VIEENLIGKILLGRPKLRWKDSVKKEVERMKPGTEWREAVDRDIW